MGEPTAYDDNESSQRNLLRALCLEILGDELGERVFSLVRPAIRLVPSTPGAPESTRLGGNPVLPAGTAWPSWREWDRPLSFLALIDLADIARVHPQGPLPRQGLLNFFYDADDQGAWGLDPADAEAWRVIYTPSDGVVVAPEEDIVTFAEQPKMMVSTLTLPGWEEEVMQGLTWDQYGKINELDSEWARRTRDRLGVTDYAPRHQIGGWPELIQGPFWEEAHLASHGFYASVDAYDDPRAIALRSGSAARSLLLQLDTDDDAGWMWGGCGMLYFSLDDTQLRNADFGAAWMRFQCT